LLRRRRRGGRSGFGGRGWGLGGVEGGRIDCGNWGDGGLEWGVKVALACYIPQDLEIVFEICRSAILVRCKTPKQTPFW
jgi:hypothetical protein